MTIKRLFLILLTSAAVALIAQWNSKENQNLKIKQLTSIACDMVSARAQAGSTRDVHDQLYSFWHKHSPGLHVDILVKHGEKEVGSLSSLDEKNTYTQTCQIANIPDYQISFQFEEHKIMSISLIEKFAAAFIIILGMSFSLWIFIRSVREFWSGEVLREIRTSWGLAVEPLDKSNILSRFLAKLLLSSTSGLKPLIEKLQASLNDKQMELTQTKTLVLSLEEERIKSNNFASIVTMVRHDLKGPLSALKITASGISQLPDESASLRQTIVSIEKIISDLDQKKNAVTSDSKELTLEIAEVAIQEVIDERFGVFSHHGIQVDFEYNPKILSPVLCNPNHLRRMFANLLQNALEASPKASMVRIGVRHDQDQVLIEIADQGPGIAPEILPTLFERGATFGKSGGSGEGLSFVKAKAESFGGEIKVVESSADGAVFQLKMPLAVTSARFLASPSDEACSQIAILDDEIEFQKLAWSNKLGRKEYFSSPQLFLNWIEKESESSSFTYLVDLHLRDVVTGLDVLRKLGKASQSYLTTSDYLNPEALALSESLGVAIIPKTLLFSTL